MTIMIVSRLQLHVRRVCEPNLTQNQSIIRRRATQKAEPRDRQTDMKHGSCHGSSLPLKPFSKNGQNNDKFIFNNGDTEKHQIVRF